MTASFQDLVDLAAERLGAAAIACSDEFFAPMENLLKAGPAIWREGFGLSIVEAMACRKPVIVSNIWSLNTLIENNVTGILIEPKQVEVLAEALASLLHDKARRRLIGERGRKMVEDYFSIERMASEIAEVYQGLTPLH